MQLSRVIDAGLANELDPDWEDLRASRLVRFDEKRLLSLADCHR